jgi:hypothetical protein
MVDVSSFQLGLLGAGNPHLVENEQKISSSTLLEGKELAILLPAVNARGYRFGRIFRYHPRKRIIYCASASNPLAKKFYATL